jgi:hypothetical protein
VGSRPLIGIFALTSYGVGSLCVGSVNADCIGPNVISDEIIILDFLLCLLAASCADLMAGVP